MIGLVTDSGSQLPAQLRDRFGIAVVPLTVVVDGVEYWEGVDITNEEFYAWLGAGASVSTSAPSPGEFAVTYETVTAVGATEILSVHLGSNISGTVNAARIAAEAMSVPVEIVDTGTASFPVACCVWAAAETRARGGSRDACAAAAKAVAAVVGNVFVAGVLELADRGGRLGAGATEGEGVPVLVLAGGRIDVAARVHDLDGAIDRMVEEASRGAAGRAQLVGVGDAAAPGAASTLAERLSGLPTTVELIRYEVGPSIGAHTGPGTVGAVFFPAEYAMRA